MTPKEEAKELVGIFKKQLDTATPTLNRPHYQSKRCALLSVDKIIQAVRKSVGKKKSSTISLAISDEYEYWQAVKEEIEKL
jgi:hypothetical protein